MGARRVGDLVAYQWARAFKVEVYRLFDTSPKAQSDLRFRDQLFEAAASIEANIAEGFARFVPGELANFLRYALGSLAECRTRLDDGVARGHFRPADIERALVFAARCESATRALRASQQRLAGLLIVFVVTESAQAGEAPADFMVNRLVEIDEHGRGSTRELPSA